MKLTAEETTQYSRHLSLEEVGERGQLQLKQAKVLVIGAGGLSCPVLQYLAAAGVGNIGIVDNDTVDPSNLQRQILYTHEDLGKYKVEAAVSRLKRLNPFIQLHSYNTKLGNDNALELFENYDIIVDGTDNFPTRYLINDAAVILKKTVVFGSINKFEGQVSVFNYNNGPTYRCLFPSPPSPELVPNCSEAGVLGILPGIIGSLQANEVLKIILGLGNIMSGKLLTFNALTLQQELFQFKKNPSLVIASLAQDYQMFCGLDVGFEEITYQEYLQQANTFNVLDVRNKEEREELTIESFHIPLVELKERYTKLATNKPLLVFCKSGVRSKLAIKILKSKNFGNKLVNLKDGINTATVNL
ncbi:molybdopterin-synthase adenylyltransferase MoeB [Aequorivita xiaoshiensis]|uniref:Molybdopterin-synthase adenylyltransferase n=1 Tax=Aequorivita xiaoshiensis TaxID=2874476 RepID=A0A9X1R5D4_9FLAO|nr:molybdopterin-synthase adenylyltransferase MoeB [Aequorivita xiaoshiensis]MCG2431828.1 molybdopterin-synthase adenylyltransferase MoeB [Aequorivita xiaoshiensis]